MNGGKLFGQGPQLDVWKKPWTSKEEPLSLDRLGGRRKLRDHVGTSHKLHSLK